MSQSAISSLLDWFVPEHLRREADGRRRTRMFVVSHTFGTPLGHLITAYLYLIERQTSPVWWTILALITAFFAYPFVLRLTGWFNGLALLSVQHLTVLVLFTSHFYGGASSPFLAWVLAVPVAGLFYLGQHRWLRALMLAALAVNLAVFYAIYAGGIVAPERVPLSQLAGAGIFSVFCAAAFVTMMALNYTNVVLGQQRELEREVLIRSAAETGLRRAKEEAERLSTYFRLMFQANPLPMWVYDRETLRFLEANDAAVAQYGYSREQFLSMTVDQMRPPEDAALLREKVREIASPYARMGIWRHLKADGGEILVDVQWHQIEFQGRPCAISSATDVTEQNRAAAAVRESERRLREILDTALDAFLIIDTEDTILAWNAAAERIFGWSAGEIIGRRLAETVVPERFRPSYHKGLSRFAETGETAVAGRRLEFIGLRRDGREFPVQVAISQLTVGGRVTLNVFIQDITERKQREQDLRDSEARYRLLAENATDIITRVALDGTRTYVSPAVRDILGYEPHELLGNSPAAALHPEDEPIAAGAIAALRCGQERVTTTFRIRRKDGSLVWLESSLRLVRDPTTGQPHEIVSVSRDVTSRQALQVALATAKDEAERANRAKSDFLANMSHELRTPLNAIMGFGDLIEHQRFGPVGNPKYAEYGHDIVESGRHLLELISDILDFAKLDAGRLTLMEETVDVRAVINSCTHMLAERAKLADLTLAAAIAPAVGMIRGDERRLRQILLNLLTNSIKFTEPHGRVAVEAYLDVGGRLALRVSDSGIGISPDDIPRVLEPFGQVDGPLSRKVDGTGLGLPLTKRLVEMHDGVLELDSMPGRGTTVTVMLPSERVLRNVA